LHLGEAYLCTHNITAALTCFERFRQAYPKSDQLNQCLFWLGECLPQQFLQASVNNAANQYGLWVTPEFNRNWQQLVWEVGAKVK